MILGRGNKRGFTLIELLVVIVIIALLMAIAIPAYLSQQKKAKDSKSKQYLTLAYKESRAALLDTSGGYPSGTTLVAAASSSEPQLKFVAQAGCYAADAYSSDTVVVDTRATEFNKQLLTLCTRSDSGTLWRLQATDTGSPSIQSYATPTAYDQQVLAKGPIAYWRFENGAVTSDSSQFGNSPTPFGGGNVSGASGALTSITSNAVTINNTSSGYIKAAPNGLSSTGVTAEAWVKVPTGNWHNILQEAWLSTPANKWGWVLLAKPSGLAGFGVGLINPSNIQNVATSTQTVNDGAYHFLVGRYDGNNVCLSVDGGPSNCTAFGAMPLSTSDYLQVGSPGDTSGMSVDEAAVYPYALSDRQIAAQYAAK